MAANKKSDPSANENIPADKSITIGGDVVDSVVIVGNKNTVNQTIIQKFFNFLDHCVDLIFLRRVGGGYIFVHRLLMEHFAEMYVENPTSKGNQK
jgi:hypothetical protein